MAKIVKSGESIEGRKLNGSSRKPIEYKGMVRERGKKLHKFMAKFNTKSSINKTLSDDDEKIVEKSNTSTDDNICCDDVLLRSLGRKHSTKKESNSSGTHSSFAWGFPKQTNCMITKSHKEIEDAMNKRQIEQGTTASIFIPQSFKKLR